MHLSLLITRGDEHQLDYAVDSRSSFHGTKHASSFGTQPTASRKLQAKRLPGQRQDGRHLFFYFKFIHYRLFIPLSSNLWNEELLITTAGIVNGISATMSTIFGTRDISGGECTRYGPSYFFFNTKNILSCQYPKESHFTPVLA